MQQLDAHVKVFCPWCDFLPVQDLTSDSCIEDMSNCTDSDSEPDHITGAAQVFSKALVRICVDMFML